jgi:hypothetical protein
LIKRILTNALLTALALVLAFGCSEFVVRIFYKDETPLFPRYHTDYRYGRYTLRGIRPNATFWHTSVDGSWQFVTNSRGFRNTKEFAYEKPPNIIRVLSLGDSQTQGYEVRQDATFSAVLERYLNTRSIPAEVINAGVSGFSTAEELVFLENEGRKYQPDIVVLGYYANDFEDNLKSGLFRLDGEDHLVERAYEHIPGVRIQNVLYGIPLARWLSENSYFYSLLFNSGWKFFKLRLAKRAAEDAAANDARREVDEAALEYAVPTTTAHSAYAIALTEALIIRMQRFCDNQQIRLLVIDIPTRTGQYRSSSSLPEAMRMSLASGAVEIIGAESLLKDFNGSVTMHVPHGARHISEFTHALIGAEVGRRIIDGRTAP